MTTLSVIIPANNEAAYIGPCLEALRQQDIDLPAIGGAEIIVAANACTDATVARAKAAADVLEAAGWHLRVLDLPGPGKLAALNHADTVAAGALRAYLDADVICEPGLMAQLVAALDRPEPRYGSGTLQVAPARSWVTRCFARVWSQLPFMTSNVQGAGLYAVNRAGRARWDSFPDIIADDGYVRLMFAPDERIKVDAAYHWPLVEGFSQLVKVRRRQDAGVQELCTRFPDLIHNESKPPMTWRDHLHLFAKMPVSYAVYVSVLLAVKAGGQDDTSWVRGR